MGHFNSVAMVASSFYGFGSAANIFVTHYSGTVNTLTFNTGSNSLSLNHSLTIGGQPSWMHWDSASRTIYATDETTYGSAKLTAVSAATNGGLTQIGQATAPGGGVAGVDQTSTISTFKLPLSSSPSAQQTIPLTMVGKGTIPSRQDAPHPHQTFVDPTGAFILAPDLGADLIRIYSIGSTGTLTSCGNYVEVGGTGPRHGSFSSDGKILYIANELSNTVHAFTVAYNNNCINLTRFQTLTTFPGNKTAPTGNKVGEIHVKGNILHVSNRRDLSFNPNDSIATFSLDSAGAMTFIDIISSGGTYPRTFDISKDGEYAAIGDQTTANVVVVKRNATSGKLGPQLASLRIGTVGQAENDNGLSAVLWDQ